MQITVHMRPAAATRGRDDAPRAAEVREVVEELGVELKPLHPGTADPTLSTHYTVEVPDAETAEKVIHRLRGHTAVEAAYLKPTDELP